MDALEPFTLEGPAQDPPPLDYIRHPAGAKTAYDLELTVSIAPEGKAPTVVSRSNFKYMYWSVFQQLAHHSVNGCNLRPGDLLASGTISGPTEDSYGSMIELSWRGTKPLKMSDGQERKLIQ
eukprot:351161_1